MSRKNLSSLIHLIAGELASSIDVAQALHQSVVRLKIADPSGIVREPLAEGIIQSLVFGACDLASSFDEVRVSAEGYVLH